MRLDEAETLALAIRAALPEAIYVLPQYDAGRSGYVVRVLVDLSTDFRSVCSPAEWEVLRPKLERAATSSKGESHEC